MIPQQQPDKGARFLLMAACFVVLIAGLKSAAGLILPFMVSVFLALISLPLLNWLQSKKIPTSIAVLITIVAALGVLSGIVLVIGGSIKDFTAEAPKYRARLETMSEQFLSWLQSRGVQLTREMTTDLFDPAAALDVVTTTLRGVTAVLSNLLLVFLTIIFILSEAAGFPAKLRAAFGDREGSERFDKVRTEIQRYLGFKTLISLVTAILVGASMSIIGVDFPMLWGALAFLLNYIPNLGSIIAAIPPTLLALVQLDVAHAIAVVLVFATINVMLGSLLEPYLMGRRLGLSTLVVFVSLVFWGWVWGPVGMLLSVPLTIICKILLENTEDLAWIAVLLDASPRDFLQRGRRLARDGSGS